MIEGHGEAVLHMECTRRAHSLHISISPIVFFFGSFPPESMMARRDNPMRGIAGFAFSCFCRGAPLLVLQPFCGY